MKKFFPAAIAAFFFIHQASAGEQIVVDEMLAPIDLPAVAAVPSDAGPRIWTFVKENTTLKVLGTIQPLRRGLWFDSEGIRTAMRSAEVLLTGEGVVTGEGIGLLRGL